jgi:hypothetical protein
MENIKFSVFDIFAYVLPGSVVLVAIFMFSTQNVTDISQYIEMAKDVSLGLGIILVMASYIIGNAADNFGSWLYYKIGCKIWGEPYPKEQRSTLSHAKQRALIREQSPENFVFIHTWKVLKTMSHNLSFGTLLIAIVAAIRYFQHQNIQWIIVAVISIILAVVFLRRATIYDKWHYNELLETVEVLQLEKRVSLASFEQRKGVK